MLDYTLQAYEYLAVGLTLNYVFNDMADGSAGFVLRICGSWTNFCEFPDHCNRDGPETTFRRCKGWFLDGPEIALRWWNNRGNNNNWKMVLLLK